MNAVIREWHNELAEIAQAYSQLEDASFSTKSVHWVLDRLLHGSAYQENDPLGEKLIALEHRAAVYLAADNFFALRGQSGNTEVDSAKQRLAIYDAHVGDIQQAVETEEQRLITFLSFMCKRNSLFLGREVLDKGFCFFSHAEVFDFFVQKNEFVEISEQDSRKDRLLMAPRSFYKSTCDSVDCVSWILSHPEVRILFLTATLGLAKSFTKEVKDYFTPVDPEHIEMPFQAIFAADFRLEKTNSKREHPRVSFLIYDTGKENEMICPARPADTKSRGPTVTAGSIGKSKAGNHVDVAKFDDVCDDINTLTSDLIEKTSTKIKHASRLVDPGGFRDFVATSYSPNDWNATIRANRDTTFLQLIRPAKTLKRDYSNATALDRGKNLGDLDITDWEYLFPIDKFGKAHLDNFFLAKVESDEPDIFPGQYMLDPRGSTLAVFTEELIQSRMIPRERMPETHNRYILADLGDSAEQYSDYSVFTLLEVSAEGTGYITHMTRGRFIPNELIFRIADLNHQFRPNRILIENSKGANKLELSIRQASKDMGDPDIPLEFFKMELQKGAKNARISRLQPRLTQKRLWFLNSIDCREELISEFVNFPNQNKHDDCIDCCSFTERVLTDARPAPLDIGAELYSRRVLESKEAYEKYFSNPEQYIDQSIEPLPADNELVEELWDPFSVTPFRK